MEYTCITPCTIDQGLSVPKIWEISHCQFHSCETKIFSGVTYMSERYAVQETTSHSHSNPCCNLHCCSVLNRMSNLCAELKFITAHISGTEAYKHNHQHKSNILQFYIYVTGSLHSQASPILQYVSACVLLSKQIKEKGERDWWTGFWIQTDFVQHSTLHL